MASKNFVDVETSPRMVLLLRVINAVAFAAVVVINKTGGPGPFGPGEFSKDHPSPITPAGFTFAIWGIIYLGQALMWFIYPFLPIVNKGLVFGRIGFLNLAICATNIAWIVLVSYNLTWLSTVVLLFQLLLQGIVYCRIHCIDGSCSTDIVRDNRTWAEYIFVYAPWALYTSWVLAASLISLFIPFDAPPEDAVYPGLLALAFAGIANLCILAWSKDIPFALVIVWALFGLFNKQLENLPLIAGACVSLGFVVSGFMIITVVREFLGTRSASAASGNDDREPLLPTGL